jgi:hypothetical protein
MTVPLLKVICLAYRHPNHSCCDQLTAYGILVLRSMALVIPGHLLEMIQHFRHRSNMAVNITHHSEKL